jgi:sodium/bile acid cotransporter 7
VVTPLLASLLLGGAGAVRLDGGAVLTLVLQLLLPFLLGQLSRRWTAGWIAAHKPLVTAVDRGSILVVIYGAFSAGMVAGVWHTVSPGRLLLLLVVCLLLLAAALTLTDRGARRLGFSREDRITVVFCGSKKSLASGLPMAAVLFASSGLGLVVLPLMLFHQVQLMACTVLARRWGAAAAAPPAVAATDVVDKSEHPGPPRPPGPASRRPQRGIDGPAGQGRPVETNS